MSCLLHHNQQEMMALADRYTIRLPICRTLGTGTPTLVLPTSPARWRQSVAALALFFKREFRYDFEQFHASESPKDPDHVPYQAWVFHEMAWDQHREEGDRPRRVLGAACFRWREYADAPACWTLDWLWFHPYERRQGHLRAAWRMFRERYGVFPVEPPVSPAMLAFLRKESPELFEG